MARTYAKLKGTIWRDDDWRALPASHQRLYLLLFSQPEISNCGVLPYLPTKWYRMAADTSIDEIIAVAADLQAARFIVVDEETCELLIRTYVKHDQVAEQPKIRAAAVRQYDQILSNRIRTALADEYPDVFRLQPHEQADPEPYGKGTGNPTETLGEGYAVPTRVRAQAVNRQPYPPTVPANHQQQPAPNDRATAAAEELRTAGWSNAQITTAAEGAHLERAAAWLHHAQADPNIHNPAGLAWAKTTDTDAWPEDQRPTIARGATGTRSNSPPLPERPPEPELERLAPPAEFVALANGHPAPEPVVSSRARKTRPGMAPSDAHAEKAAAPDPEGDL